MKSDENISNSIVVHYVLQGTSATIQNLSLDKISYKKGETAILSFFWSASADNFLGSRGSSQEESEINLYATVTNSKGKSCGEPLNQLLNPKTNFVKIPFSVTSNCVDPQLSLSLKDATGNILAEQTFSIETTKEKGLNNIWLIVIIAIIILVVIGMVLKKKNENSNDNNPNNSVPMGVLFLFITLFALVALFSANKASADTYTYDGITYTYSLNKYIYQLGENIIATGSTVDTNCNNSNADASIVVTGEKNYVTLKGTDMSGTLLGPDNPGSYNAKFKLMDKYGFEVETFYIPYVVVAPPTVDVKVDTVDGPITKSTGSSVNVSWTSENASRCSCSYVRAGETISCGTELFRSDESPVVISNLLEPTTFTVTCDP